MVRRWDSASSRPCFARSDGIGGAVEEKDDVVQAVRKRKRMSRSSLHVPPAVQNRKQQVETDRVGFCCMCFCPSRLLTISGQRRRLHSMAGNPLRISFRRRSCHLFLSPLSVAVRISNTMDGTDPSVEF
ncbi:unnamed protein product [Musa acuminata subsp. burmannicoides]